MCITNVSVSEGLANGTRLLFQSSAEKGKLRFRPFSKPSEGLLELKRARMTYKRKGVKLIRNQFPLRLAWAVTIHKSQGQTIARLGFFLPKGGQLFAEGMAYTMFSRLKSLEQLRIFAPERKSVSTIKGKF